MAFFCGLSVSMALPGLFFVWFVVLYFSTVATAEGSISDLGALKKRQRASDCLASLSSAPEPSSAISFSCAQLLNTRFYTATEVFSTPVTVSDMRVTIRVLTETARVPTTIPGVKTVINWNNVTSPATYTNVSVAPTKTFTSNWNAWIISATKTVQVQETQTVTKTVGRATRTASKLTTITTTIAAKTTTKTIYANPLPDPLPETKCPPELASAACSIYITAPVPTPVTTVSSLVAYPTLTTFTDTHAITITSTIFTLITPGPSTTTVNRQSTVFSGTSTVYVGHTTTVTTLGTKTRYVATQKSAIVTVTETKTVPTITQETIIQTHTPTPEQLTKSITIPSACSSHYLLSGTSWSPLADPDGNARFRSLVVSETAAKDDQLLCCAKCFDTEGCAIFEFKLGESCTLNVVSESMAKDKEGWVSGVCPNGQLFGKVIWDGNVGEIGVGPCWNGEVTGFGG